MEKQLTRRDLVGIAIKGIRLDKYLSAYKNAEKEIEVQQKFNAVWGEHIASHFLDKYDDAENLIHHLDDDNFRLFIERF